MVKSLSFTLVGKGHRDCMAAAAHSAVARICFVGSSSRKLY